MRALCACATPTEASQPKLGLLIAHVMSGLCSCDNNYYCAAVLLFMADSLRSVSCNSSLALVAIINMSDNGTLSL